MEANTRKRRKPMSEINVVPMIDVMLVLLVVFMVTTPLITQGVKIELPEANSEVIEEPEVTFEITIDAEGQYFYNVGEVEVDNPTPVAPEEIGRVVTAIMNENPGVPVYLNGDGAVSYGAVMKLYSILQEAGVKELNLITQPESLAP
jgi:biopolymer transport protein TolR